ncbi:hypothetical protein C4568_04005 [Candidatus Parcubacteria bacterium]|nr:MAG: hypothetical protein C4568_04005 [Candidatus Parcubacteria bacterium]
MYKKGARRSLPPGPCARRALRSLLYLDRVVPLVAGEFVLFVPKRIMGVARDRALAERELDVHDDFSAVRIPRRAGADDRPETPFGYRWIPTGRFDALADMASRDFEREWHF